MDEDDAVIVPAPPVSALAHSQAYRPPTRPESGLSLGLRRTMIPILLTLGIEMFALLVLGALSPRDATFSMFIKPGIAIMLAVLGLLFLPAGLFLMFQVRNELSRRPPG